MYVCSGRNSNLKQQNEYQDIHIAWHSQAKHVFTMIRFFSSTVQSITDDSPTEWAFSAHELIDSSSWYSKGGGKDCFCIVLPIEHHHCRCHKKIGMES